MAGAAPGGGLGADIVGGLGADMRDDSGSDRYEDSRLAVHTTNTLDLCEGYTWQLGLGRTSCVYSCASLSQFWHSPRKQSTQLRSVFDSRSRRHIPAALVAVASSSVSGDGWCEAAWRSRHTRNGWCSSQWRRAGPPGRLRNYRCGSIIGDSFLQSFAFADIR